MSDKYVVEFDFTPCDKVLIDGGQEAVVDTVSSDASERFMYLCEWQTKDGPVVSRWYAGKRLKLK